MELFRKYDWMQVALLAEDGQDFPEYHGFLQDLFISSGINVVYHRRLPRQATTDDSVKVETLRIDLLILLENILTLCRSMVLVKMIMTR